MFEPTIILHEAYLTAEPERKTTKNGDPFLMMRFASNGRRKNKQTGQWDNTITVFATVFEFDLGMIETYARELHMKMPVRIEGNLRLSASLDRNGQPRTDVTIEYPKITKILPKTKQQQPIQSQQQSAWGQPTDNWASNEFGDNGGFC